MSPIAERLEDENGYMRFSVGMQDWRTEVWAKPGQENFAILEAVNLMANGWKPGKH